MRILDIREKTVSLGQAARNASIGFGGMTASAVIMRTDAVRDGKPVTGVAFDSIGRYGHSGLLRERFMPRLLAADPERYGSDEGLDPHKAWGVMMTDEKPGGHGERCGAVGLLDAALWDIKAKLNGEPLWATLSREHGDAASKPDGTAAVYASGGHYRDENDVALLCEDIRRAIAQGHRRFKIKIGGVPLEQDIARIEAVLAILEPCMTLAVDGNGTFNRAKTQNYLDALANFPLAWIEEPTHPLDYALQREVAEMTKLPIATGENLFSRDDAKNLIAFGGLCPDRDVLQFDISLSYGFPEYIRILDDLAAQGWSRERFAPHAGHLLAAQGVAGLSLGMAEVAMDTSSLFGSLTAHLNVADGVATLPDAPGVGLEALPVFHAVFDDLLN